jgi:hypothetical protein
MRGAWLLLYILWLELPVLKKHVVYLSPARSLARIFHTVSANAPPPTTGSSNLGLPDQHPLGLQIPDSMGGARFLSYEFNAG